MSVSNLDVCVFAYEGTLDLLKAKLSQHNELLTKVDQSGRMAIHWASSGGRTEVIEYLLKQGVPVDVRDESNWTPLMIAVSAGHSDIVALLVSSAQVNAVNSTGQCSLHYAASKDRFQIAEALLQCGADANIGDWMNSTPLHRASSKGHAKIAKLLLSYNADPNIADSQGNTPLHAACEEEHAELIKLLIENSASLTARNKDEKTPADLAPPSIKRTLRMLMET